MDEILIWFNPLPLELQSIDWSLLISILALTVSLYMAFLYRTEISFLRKQLNLEQKRYEEEQKEKKRKALEISVQRFAKYPGGAARLEWIGIWLIVNNRSGEEVLLQNSEITLYFSRDDRDVSILTKWFRAPGYYKPYLSFSHSGFQTESNMSCDAAMNRHFYLVDWETKQHISYDPYQPYRLPAAVEKKTWYLFGAIPEKVGEDWIENDIYLHAVHVNFKTDQGEASTFSDRCGSVTEDDLKSLILFPTSAKGS
jgi:hypothetical protein